MKRKTIIWIILLCAAITTYFGCCRFFELEGRKFVQKKTGIMWPAGITHVRVFECPGIRPHWTEEFLVLPKDSLPEFLRNGFTQYDPALADESPDVFGAGFDQARCERWVKQSQVFSYPSNPLSFFASEDKVADRRLTLGPHIYYTTGDKTGFNRFYIVVDSTNGNTWVHVSYPD